MKYTDIQNEIVQKYRITLCPDSKCWSRTHAHIKKRTVCKWKQTNSIASTFTLFHEVGHIENNKGNMRRAEQEYFATIWAIDKFHEYGLEVPERTIEVYQAYIDMEKERGLRRGGAAYGELSLKKHLLTRN